MLCSGERLTDWHYEDETCWVTDCVVCMTPMVVWRTHGLPDEGIETTMLGHLERIAADRYGADGFYVDGERRRIPDHWHAHARPAGGFFDPRSELFDASDVLTVEPMQVDDAEAVLAIYAEAISVGDATFETAAPSWEGWDALHLAAPRSVARYGGAVVGWAALSPVSDRCAYEGVAEVSVYVGERSRRHGAGRALLDATILASEDRGIWTLQAGLFPENEASIRLHRSCGFREVGRRERIGTLGGRWRDVLLFERRSPRVGTDEASHA